MGKLKYEEMRKRGVVNGAVVLAGIFILGLVSSLTVGLGVDGTEHHVGRVAVRRQPVLRTVLGCPAVGLAFVRDFVHQTTKT